MALGTYRYVSSLIPASSVSYDNTVSGLTATEVQSAIDELQVSVNSGFTLIPVANYSALPAANSLPAGSLRLVIASQGIWPFTFQDKGIYRTDGIATWTRIGATELDSSAIYYDNTVSGLTANDVKDALDELAAASGGGVTSFNARTGAVVSVAGDYTAAQITNVPAGTISAITLQAAVNELDSEKSSKADNFMYALIFG